MPIRKRERIMPYKEIGRAPKKPATVARSKDWRSDRDFINGAGPGFQEWRSARIL